VTSVQIHKREIGIASADGFVYRYDVMAGKVRRDFVSSEVCSFWLADGCLLVQSQDGALRLLDSEGGALLGTFAGHKVTEYRPEVQMTLDKVYASCETGKIRVWDILTQNELNPIFVRDEHPTTSFDIFDDGIVASAGSKLFLRSTK
jgi:WD40 repeat protein